MTLNNENRINEDHIFLLRLITTLLTKKILSPFIYFLSGSPFFLPTYVLFLSYDDNLNGLLLCYVTSSFPIEVLVTLVVYRITFHNMIRLCHHTLNMSMAIT